MGEEADNNNTRSYVPSDAEIETAGLYPNLLDPLLTDEEIKALTLRSDRGLSHPVPQYQPESLEEFKDWQNNFYSFFRKGGGFDVGKRRFKVFQRFAVLNPDLADRLFDEIEQHDRTEAFSSFSESLWQDLYQAYQEMAQLVDANDRYVSTDGGGEPDRYFLKR